MSNYLKISFTSLCALFLSVLFTADALATRGVTTIDILYASPAEKIGSLDAQLICKGKTGPSCEGEAAAVKQWFMADNATSYGRGLVYTGEVVLCRKRTFDGGHHMLGIIVMGKTLKMEDNNCSMYVSVSIKCNINVDTSSTYYPTYPAKGFCRAGKPW